MRTHFWRLAAAGAALTVLTAGCGLSLQQLPKIGDISGTYPVYAQFANVLNLPQNAQVHEGTQIVGQVGTIKVDNFHADVELKIRNGIRLPVGTTAEVRFDNPLGEEYVLLRQPSRPASGYLTAKANIPLAKTDTAPSVEDTLAALSTVLNGGGIGQLGIIIHELNQTFAGNQLQIRDLLSNINAAVTALATNSTSVDNALAAIGNLFRQFNQGSGTLVTGVNTIGPAINILANENGQFGQLLTQLSRLSTIGNAVLQQSGQNSVNSVKALLPVVNQIVAVESQLGPDLNDLSAFEAETPKIAPGNYLQASVTANVNLNSAPSCPYVTPPTYGPCPKVAAAAAAAAGVAAPSGPVNGVQAISAVLEGGLR
jgi:phospholipid/cholesterol/gamma-HCH transport system substrate-binding protein